MSGKRPGGSAGCGRTNVRNNGGGSFGGGRSFTGGGRRGGGNIRRSFSSIQGRGRGINGICMNFDGNNSGGCSSGGGGKFFGGSGGRFGGSKGGGDRFLSFNGGHGSNGGGDRFLSFSGGRAGGDNIGGSDRFRSFSGGRAGGDSSHSGAGRKGGSIYVGGRAGGSHNGGGRIDGGSLSGCGKIDGGSMSGMGNKRDHESHLRTDDLYDASSKDSEKDDQYDNANASDNSDDEARDLDYEDGGGGDIEGSGTETDDGDDIFYSKRGFSLVGCIGTKDIDRCCPRWWRFIRKKFFNYYTYDSRYGTEQDARRAVSYHMHENIRKTQANERKRVHKLIKENGGSFISHRPPYLSEPVWEAFCKYWDTPEFQKKSDAAKKNRKKLLHQHRSGATSFRRRAWDILEETGKEPGEYHLFLKTHTDNNGIYTSEDVGVLMEQYVQLCEKQNEDPNNAPICTWVKAVGVRKNGILGVPRTKASDILSIERSRKRCRRYEDDESGASTNGRSLHMADEFVIQTVDQTVAYARTHPDEFGLAPEQVFMLEKSVSVAEGDGELPSDHPLSMGTMTELVHVMVTVSTDIQEHQKSDNNKGKGKSFTREDGCSSLDMPHSPPADQCENLHTSGD